MKAATLTPVNDHILVEMPKDPKTSKVFIPKTIRDSAQIGIVISIAKDCSMKSLKKGDRIRWEMYAEADGIFDYDGKKVCLIKAKQVMGVYGGEA